MFNLFKQLKTSVKALKALTDYKFNILDKRIFNILHDEEFEMITTEFSELTWDGNTEGLTSVFVDGGGFYLIYDNPPTFEEASAGGRMINSILQNEEMVDEVFEYTSEDVVMQNDNLYIINNFCVITLDNNVEFQGVVFPKKGIYFASINIPSQFVMCAKSLSINDYTFSSTEKVIITPLKKIDKKYLPDDIGAKPDWNVNDSKASGYIANRTHWVENPKEVTLIENEEIVVNSVVNEVTPSFFVKLTFGQNYTVIFNNQVYECVAHSVDEAIAIGNDSIMTGSMDTGEPFFMADLSSFMENTNFFMSSETGTHTITIKTIDSGIHKLDNKFLSNEIINVADAYKNEDLVTWDNMPEIYDDVIRYDTTQNLNNTQKSQAILNLGLNDILRYSPQSLTDAQKTQVQTNLGISDTINNLHAVAKSGDYNDLENKPTYDLFTDSFGEDYLYGSNILFEENKINTEEIEAKIFEITDSTPIYEKISESTSEIVYEYFSHADVSFLLNFYNKGVTSVRVIGIDSNPNNNFEFYATIDVKKVYVDNEEWTSCYIGDKNLNYRRTNYYGSTISIPKNPPIFIGSIFNSSSDKFLIAKSNTLKKVIINPENPKEIRENFIPNTIARKSDLKNIDLTGYATEDFVSEKFNQLSQEKASKATTLAGYGITDGVTNEQIEQFSGTVEITSDAPTKEKTVLTIDPSAEEINVYSAEEIDAKFEEVNEKIVELENSNEGANVTASNIVSALGYIPANDNIVSNISSVFNINELNNIVNPNNAESGYYDITNLDKVDSVSHIRTIIPIQLTGNSSKLYIASNLTDDTNIENYNWIILYLDTNGNYISYRASNFTFIFNTVEVYDIPAECAQIHMYISGVGYGLSFNNICVSEQEITEYQAYAEEVNVMLKNKCMVESIGYVPANQTVVNDLCNMFEIVKFNNIVNPNNYEPGYFDGDLNKVDSTNHIRTINPIPITGGSNIYITCNLTDTTNLESCNLIIFKLDADGNILGSKNMKFSNIFNQILIDTTPAECTQIHMYISGVRYGYTFDNICISEVEITEYEAYSEKEIFTKLKDEYAPTISYKPFYGKTIVNFGDSIFGKRRPPEDISTRLSELTGATVHNCGFGGCRMAQHSLPNYDAFSMYRLTDSIINNDWTLQDAGIANTAQSEAVPSYFSEGLAILKQLDFNKVDIITIAYGTNDFTAGVNMDNSDNALDTTTFAGALRYSIENLLTAYPHLKIFVCSQTYRFWMDSDNVFTDDSDTHVNADSVKLTDFVAKTKEIAEDYHLPYINNYDIGMSKYNRGYYFPANDGTHPLTTGCHLIAEHIAKELF